MYIQATMFGYFQNGLGQNQPVSGNNHHFRFVAGKPGAGVRVAE